MDQAKLDAAIEQLRGLPDEKLWAALSGVEKEALAEEARESDTPEAYFAYYKLTTATDLPEHSRHEIYEIYKAHEEGTGTLIFGFRGSWKTTAISEHFTSFRIGKEPHKTNIIVGANDDSAEKVTRAIATIIEKNPGWKMVFPNVVPDTQRGWSNEGYWVTDSSMTGEAWAQQQSAVIDPTLVGGGYKSSRLIGKHPNGVLVIDDIHDRDNAISERERAAVVDTLSKTILKTTIKDTGEREGKLITWLIAIGTPWAVDDGYYYMKDTGQFRFVNIPAMVQCEEGEGVYIDGKNINGMVFDDIVGWWKLRWPERFGPKAIIFERSFGKGTFWQMIMLDLSASKASGLKYYTYPHESIDPHWVKGGGVDFATVMDNKPNPGRDKFSLCEGTKTPLNQVVVFDGVIEQCTQAQAEEYMKTPQNLAGWRRTVIEGDGVGEQFFVGLIRRNPGLRVDMRKTGGKQKRYRQEKELGPWLENGIIMISDADTPYLCALRKALDDFPDGNNDIRDGLYWMAFAFPECMVIANTEDSLPKTTPRVAPKNGFAMLMDRR